MNQDNIQVEIASIDDANKILEIQKAAFLDQARIYNNYQLPPLTQSLESIKNEFDGKTFLKVMLKDRIIASVRFKEVEGNVTIDRIVVEPEYQNKGIGTILLKEIESRVPNAVAFQLFTGNKSERNIYLYEKMGYQVIKNQLTDQGIELLYMEKSHNQHFHQARTMTPGNSGVMQQKGMKAEERFQTILSDLKKKHVFETACSCFNTFWRCMRDCGFWD